jgi:tetratricopeptide (TPR) repeat protein
MQESSKVKFFDKIAFLSLSISTFLLPLFVIPFTAMPFESQKAYLLGLGVIITLVSWVIARLMEGAVLFPKSPIVYAAIAVPVVAVISGFFSGSPQSSFGGPLLPVGTVVMITVLFLLFIMGLYYYRDIERIKSFFKGFAWIFVVISIFQIAYLFIGPKYMSLGVFSNVTSNVIGNWNDLSIFFGLSTIICLIVLEMSKLKLFKKIMIITALVVSLLFLALTNFAPVWLLVSIGALLIFVYSLIFLRAYGEEPKNHFPVAPFVTLLVGLLFVIANGTVGGLLSNLFGANYAEVRPSLEATIEVTWQSIKENPVLGIGPNRFDNAWLMYRPAEIVNTQFWNTGFSSGYGFLLSYLTTMGLLGGLAWLAFFIIFILLVAFHAFRVQSSRNHHMYLLMTALGAFYLWIIALIYNPGTVIIALAFIFSSLYIALLASDGKIQILNLKFLGDPRHSFFSIIACVFILLVSISGLFIGVQRFVALSYFGKALVSSNQGELDKSINLLDRSVSLYESDLYLRNLSNLALSKMNSIITNDKLSEDDIKTGFQTTFQAAEDYAKRAIRYDPTNPENWINLASVYQAVVPLKVEGAYNNAKFAYDEAEKLSPRNPAFNILRARLEINSKNNDEARVFVNKALEQKPNFIEALFLLAQIDLIEGNTVNAIAQVEKASRIDPYDANVFFQLGILRYNSKDYQGAVSALTRSINLNPQTLNAYYFLGLSYEKNGNIEDTKKVFEFLAKNIPENEDIKKINENLSSGKQALDGLSNESNSEPLSDATQLPIEEQAN